jgi:FAD/FMN-containing dehydrogenase
VFLRDQLQVIADGRFDSIYSAIVPASSGGWLFVLDLVVYHTPPLDPPAECLLGGLSFERGAEQVEDQAYLEHLLSPGAQLAEMQAAEYWSVPHPWLDVFLPASRASEFVDDVLTRMSPADLGSGMIALCPINTARLRAPLVKVPDEAACFIFDVARFASVGASDPGVMVADNRELYQRARAIGGTLYPVGAVPLTHEDWRRHYDSVWERLASAKRAYDPSNVLASTYGAFSDCVTA